MSDEQREAAASHMAERLLTAFSEAMAAHPLTVDADEEDMVSIGVMAAVGLAACLAATRCVDEASVVALIRTSAEGFVSDIYGPAP